MMRTIMVVMLAVAAPSMADACSCVTRAPLCARLSDLERPRTAVFVGRVTQVYPDSGDLQSYFSALYGNPSRNRDGSYKPVTFGDRKARLLKVWAESLSRDEVEGIKKADSEESLPKLFYEMRWSSVRRIRLTVVESFVGDSGKTFALFTGLGAGDCGVRFREGHEWLVFAYQVPASGRWSTDICNGTNLLKYSANEVSALRAWKSGQTLAPHIYGSVADWTERRDQATFHSSPMAGRKVILRAAGGQERETTTDPEGNFLFSNWDRRRYTISVPLNGWRVEDPTGPDLVGDLSSRPCASVNVYMRQDQGEILGRLMVHSGETLPASLRVEVIPVLADGNLVLKWARADAKGRFQVKSLEPGEYVLRINASPISISPFAAQPVDSPYPAVYFPGVSDLASARRIVIERGKVAEMPPWKMPERLPQRMLRGRVVWPDGKPAKGVRVRVVRVSTGSVVARTKSGPENDEFSFAGFAGAEYRVQAAAWQGIDAYFWAEGAITGSPAEPLVLKLQPDGRKARDPEFFGGRW